jgi:predicted glycosyltransferase
MRKRILLSPLDWGLGHTTRCVPIIRYLTGRGHHVTMACNPWQKSFLARVLPHLAFIHLEGYSVRYDKKSIVGGLVLQIPRLLKKIEEERDWLLKTVENQGFDAIISDNRYGLHHPQIPSAIITHQLRLHTGMGQLVDSALERAHDHFLSCFHQIWIPDVPGHPNLAGKLAHTSKTNDKHRYIGLLSQFDDQLPTHQNGKHMLILLSGQEPHRTALSTMLWQQATKVTIPIVFVEGSTTAPVPPLIPPHIKHYQQVVPHQLRPLLETASCVVCRSGYSTIMDVLYFQKPAMLIPTPGQKEQEYLQRHLQKEHIFPGVIQNRFHLSAAVNTTISHQGLGLFSPENFCQYRQVIDNFVNVL